MNKQVEKIKAGLNIPSVRFDGFSDEWETKKFKEFVSKTGKKNSKNENYIPYSVSNKDGLVIQSDQFDGGRLCDLDKSSYKFVHPKEFAYNPARINVGSIAYNDMEDSVIVSSLYVVVRMNDSLDNDFIMQYFNSYDFIKEVRRNVEGSVREYLFFENFSNIAVPYTPSLDEQTEIGNFFKTVDDLIQAQEQQVTHYEQYKEAMLQKLFPKKGKKEPKLSLDGFSGEWEAVKLGEVFERTSTKGRSNLPFITVSKNETNKRSDGAQGYGNDVSESARKKAKVILKGQFLIDLSSYERGFYVSRMDGLTSNAYHVLDLKSGDVAFWSEFLSGHEFVQSLKRLTPPGARQGKMIEVKDLIKSFVLQPSLPEQQAIGNFFKALDDTIEEHKNKAESYKELKHAFLQKMFV